MEKKNNNNMYIVKRIYDEMYVVYDPDTEEGFAWAKLFELEELLSEDENHYPHKFAFNTEAEAIKFAKSLGIGGWKIVSKYLG